MVARPSRRPRTPTSEHRLFELDQQENNEPRRSPPGGRRDQCQNACTVFVISIGCAGLKEGTGAKASARHRGRPTAVEGAFPCPSVQAAEARLARMSTPENRFFKFYQQEYGQSGQNHTHPVDHGQARRSEEALGRA